MSTTRIRTLVCGAVGAVVATTALLLPAPSAAGAAPAGAAPAKPTTLTKTFQVKALAGPQQKSAGENANVLADPPDPAPYECLFGWEVSWPAGNPVPITHASWVTCGPDIGVLDPAITVQSTLRSALFQDVAPQVTNWDEAISESTSAPWGRPVEVRVHHQSTTYLTPDNPQEPDIWYYLPEGCAGVGTPLAICDFTSETFVV